MVMGLEVEVVFLRPDEKTWPVDGGGKPSTRRYAQLPWNVGVDSGIVKRLVG